MIIFRHHKASDAFKICRSAFVCSIPLSHTLFLFSFSFSHVPTNAEDCQWAHMAGMKSCLIHIGAAHTLDTLRSGYVHTVIESLGELQAMLGGENVLEGEEQQQTGVVETK